ncbi:MAG TPA: glycosyl hydrolase [Opitutaceae bacterium]|nr:glycosyl hydrolase [Opitutaceae bacterium]
MRLSAKLNRQMLEVGRGRLTPPPAWGIAATSWPRAVTAVFTLGALALLVPARAAASSGADLQAAFQHPPESARPWVYWYWMNAAVSKPGIAADLAAMKQAGVEGAYLMPIKGPAEPPLVTPPVVQLSPAWWDCVKFAFHEADRLGLKLALHDCDGFATAGGPWITPALSMQKIVWTDTPVEGGRHIELDLPQPETNQGYYRDIAVYAVPDRHPETEAVPVVTTSVGGAAPQFLASGGGSKEGFRSKEPCWIEYAYPVPFTCRNITIRTPPSMNAYTPFSYQANRLTVEVSDDGVTFRRLTQLVPPREGWQDGDADTTHAIPAVTARYFRFQYDPAGSEPGAEDLDSAKWKSGLGLSGILLSGEPRIDEYEGKSGAVWRISAPTTGAEIPATDCVPLASVRNLTGHLDGHGRLGWDAPPGHWRILRFGHTSTNHFNDTGGGGKGLECDKFDPVAVRLQYEHWFGEAVRQLGPELAGRVLKVFHVDSWECASQNWSPVFRTEFQRRRGYDPLPYLPVMAGVPVDSAEISERFLRDVRTTIAELLDQNFFGTMAQLAHAQGCVFSSESVAPTMVSDSMGHYAYADIPMGEFWLRSADHDKLNDVLDAVSGARVYGHPVAQAEAFTELFLKWDEAPWVVKSLQDRNYSFGINRLVYHVFAENPWLDRRPGMTLSGVGLFFQRDQTWWRPGRAWVEYAKRCQALLQEGHAVSDVAVFTGEEIPRRAYVPWQLHSTLPGMITPVAEVMAGRKTPQILAAGDWIDPLHGYSYDSINRDALLRLAHMHNGRLELPGGARYRVLVIPAENPMNPIGGALTPEVAERLRQFATEGLTVILGDRPGHSPSLVDYPRCDTRVAQAAAELWPRGESADGSSHRLGRGRVVTGPYRGATFEKLGIPRDVMARTNADVAAKDFTWTHRAAAGWDIYFLSNQEQAARDLTVSLRINDRAPELWDAVTGEMRPATSWRTDDGRTVLPLHFAPAGSVFVVFRTATTISGEGSGLNGTDPAVTQTISEPWQVTFESDRGGPAAPVTFANLVSWTTRTEPGIRNYSGTAAYRTTLDWHAPAAAPQHVWLDLGTVHEIAEVTVNGVDCGVAWTPPFRVDIGAALRNGKNELRIAVTNTWFNRLAGDQELPPAQRLTWTTAPDRTAGKPLLPAGLFGPVTIRTE